jgi:cysteinyl-tRNA synthetase
VDNIFPHHEDEIAQSEAATGKPFAHTWLHCAHLVVDGKKMSKSLGNYYTLRNVLHRGYSGREIRYELMATHYRQPLNFTFEALDAARAALGRLDEFSRRLQDAAKAGESETELPSWAAVSRDKFTTAMDDDLNISEALAALFDLVYAGNKALNDKIVSIGEIWAVLALLDEWNQALGFIRPPEETADPEALTMLELRQQARTFRNWTEADRLRDELAARGWIVQDTPQGSKLKRK